MGFPGFQGNGSTASMTMGQALAKWVVDKCVHMDKSVNGQLTL